MTYMTRIASPVGMLHVASDGENITGLWIEGQKYFGATLNPEAQEKRLPIFASVRKWLDIYFSGKQPDVLPPLSPLGSTFRQAVWSALLTIPYGQTTTYGSIAKQLEKAFEKPVSAQAVGGAVGHNPISILIPCHRVIGSNGSLTGYAGGMEKKIELLKLEGAFCDHFFTPLRGTAL